MSKKIEKTLASLLFAIVTSGGSSKMQLSPQAPFHRCR